MELKQQRYILERFLNYHGIDTPVSARLSHLGRRVRAYFPEISDMVNPYPGPWTSKKILALCKKMEALSPENYVPKPDCRHFKKRPDRQQTKTQQFLRSRDWRHLRFEVLADSDGRCKCCGVSRREGAQLQVDHIKPLSKYWDLRLDKNNLQVLCKECNKGKSNRFETRF